MNIQRYFHALDGSMETDDNGQYVLYADHVAALRACEERIDKAWHEYDQLAREGAYLSGVQAARDAVAALAYEVEDHDGIPRLTATEALAAIDALRGES